MKIFEVLKQENIDKKYRIVSDNPDYNVYVFRVFGIEGGGLILCEHDDITDIFILSEILKFEFEEVV
jgi:hypothetical protein